MAQRPGARGQKRPEIFQVRPPHPKVKMNHVRPLDWRRYRRTLCPFFPAERSMTVIRFPVPGRPAQGLAEGLARMEALREEGLRRRAGLREEARRLDASLHRLRFLARRMARTRRSLGRSLRRLRSLRRSLGH
jgi:hypothetical protein